MEKGKYSACQVAEWFLNYVRLLYAEEDEEFLTNLKLQKLLYYAQGSCLALNDKPLFNEEIVHWMHGPAVPSVYQEYCSYRGILLSAMKNIEAFLMLKLRKCFKWYMSNLVNTPPGDSEISLVRKPHGKIQE